MMPRWLPSASPLQSPAINRQSRSTGLPRFHWADLLLIPVFLLFFTTRLVPEPVADRSIYESVAERLIAGDRLYVDVIDNKDPLFYYAIAAQRLLGPFAEYAFELACVLGSALIAAAFARKFHPGQRLGHRLVALVVAFMLTGPLYDLGGSIPPGIFLSLATIWLASSGRGTAAGLALAALLFTKLIYAPIALTFVAICAMTRPIAEHRAAGFLLRGGASCLGLSAAILLVLAGRGELSGYLAVQQANLLYSATNVFSASTLLGNLENHVITAVYFGKVILPVSLAGFVFVALRLLRTSTGDPLRSYLAACLAIYPVSLGVALLTVIWGPHLAVLHIFLALVSAVAVPDLLRTGGRVLACAAFLAAAWVLSGAGPDNWLASDPRDFPDRLADLAAPALEALALHQVAGPGPLRYARLGSDNDLHHASGTRGDRLVCPRFFQYRFTQASQLESIIACASRADYLIVDFPEDEPLAPGTFVTPVAGFAELNARWRRFTAATESMLQRSFICVHSGETIRICKRKRPR